MNERAIIGGNNPPDPIDAVLAPYMDALTESDNWLDGSPVETEGQMKEVDGLIKSIRSAKSEFAKAEKDATAPLHDIWKAEIARWKPTKEDLERRLKGLAHSVDSFKRDLAVKKEAAKRAAYEEARRLEREAEAAARAADPANIEAATEAARLQHEAIEAKKAAAAANKDTVKGLRTVTKYTIQDHRTALLWIMNNDREAVTAFIEEYVRRNHKAKPIEGVHTFEEKEAF